MRDACPEHLYHFCAATAPDISTITSFGKCDLYVKYTAPADGRHTRLSSDGVCGAGIFIDREKGISQIHIFHVFISRTTKSTLQESNAVHTPHRPRSPRGYTLPSI